MKTHDNTKGVFISMIIHRLFLALMVLTPMIAQEVNIGPTYSTTTLSNPFPVDTVFRPVIIEAATHEGFYVPLTLYPVPGDTVTYTVGAFTATSRWDYSLDTLDLPDIQVWSLEDTARMPRDTVYYGENALAGVVRTLTPSDTAQTLLFRFYSDSLRMSQWGFLTFLVKSDIMGDLGSLMPLEIGNVWRYSGPWPEYSAERWEVISEESYGDTHRYTIERERKFSPYSATPGFLTTATSIVQVVESRPFRVDLVGGTMILGMVCDFAIPPNVHYYTLFGWARESSEDWLFYQDGTGFGQRWKLGVGLVHVWGDNVGTITQLEAFRVGDSTVGWIGNLVSVDDHEDPLFPEEFGVSAFPNPFNPSINIEYKLPEHLDVSLQVIDITGREIQTLVSTSQASGNYTATWDGLDHDGHQVPGGMYFARMQAGEYSSVVKMVYLR